MPTSTGQLNRIFMSLVCTLLLSFFSSAANLRAQDKPAQKQPARLPKTLTPQQIIELNEIAALRARLGGGVTERLEGVVPGSNPDQQFEESLKGIVGSQPRTQLLLPTPNTPAKVKNSKTFEALTNPKLTKAKSDQEVLRWSARKLEELAAELEQARFYDKADELRKTAAGYWLQARSMD